MQVSREQRLECVRRYFTPLCGEVVEAVQRGDVTRLAALLDIPRSAAYPAEWPLDDSRAAKSPFLFLYYAGHGSNLLMVAARYPHPRVLLLLLERGADPLARAWNKHWNPLMRLASDRTAEGLECARLLCSNPLWLPELITQEFPKRPSALWVALRTRDELAWQGVHHGLACHFIIEKHQEVMAQLDEVLAKGEDFALS